MTDDEYAEECQIVAALTAEAHAKHQKRVHSLGVVFDVPTVDGLAQVPIVMDQSAITELNRQLRAALQELDDEMLAIDDRRQALIDETGRRLAALRSKRVSDWKTNLESECQPLN